MQILEDLWHGQISPAETGDYRKEYYLELVNLCACNEERFLPTLSQSQEEVFQKLKDLWEEMEQVSECAAFIAGFRLAVQLMASSV